MLSLEQIVEQLKQRKLRSLAQDSGVGYATIWRISVGKAPNVSYAVVKKLSDTILNQTPGEK